MKRVDKLLYNLPEQKQSVVLTISRHFYTLRIIFVKTVIILFGFAARKKTCADDVSDRYI